MHNPKEFSMQKDLSHHMTKVQRGECLTKSNEMMGHAFTKTWNTEVWENHQ